MKISIELHTRVFATVHFVPSLVERLIGKRGTERSALFTAGRWHWVHGHPVCDRVERKLVDAVRDLIVARATSPPS